MMGKSKYCTRCNTVTGLSAMLNDSFLILMVPLMRLHNRNLSTHWLVNGSLDDFLLVACCSRHYDAPMLIGWLRRMIYRTNGKSPLRVILATRLASQCRFHQCCQAGCRIRVCVYGMNDYNHRFVWFCMYQYNICLYNEGFVEKQTSRSVYRYMYVHIQCARYIMIIININFPL